MKTTPKQDNRMAGEQDMVLFESELTERQRELIHKFAAWVVKRRMSTPAILFLESVRPLNFVGSQIMVFFQPVVQAFFKLSEWDEIRKILEERESVGYLIDLIESKESDYLLEEKNLKLKLKAERQKAREAKLSNKIKKN